MFGMFKVEKKIETPCEQKLEEIKNILFPPTETKESKDEKTGEILQYSVDYSADSNLEAALTDIQEGYVDGPVFDTIKNVSDRIYKIRKILDTDIDFDKNSKYIIVDTKKDYDPANIEAEHDQLFDIS